MLLCHTRHATLSSGHRRNPSRPRLCCVSEPLSAVLKLTQLSPVGSVLTGKSTAGIREARKTKPPKGGPHRVRDPTGAGAQKAKIGLGTTTGNVALTVVAAWQHLSTQGIWLVFALWLPFGSSHFRIASHDMAFLTHFHMLCQVSRELNPIMCCKHLANDRPGTSNPASPRMSPRLPDSQHGSIGFAPTKVGSSTGDSPLLWDTHQKGEGEWSFAWS